MSGIEHEGVGPAFRTWRAHRPFLGGVLLTLGGLEILFTVKVSLKIVIHMGVQGIAGYVLPTMMVVCGLLIIFNPAQRLFYSIVGCMLTLGTWVTSNMGGFFVGLALGITGSCMAFGWLPDQEPKVSRKQRRMDKAQGKAAMAGPDPADSTEPTAADDGHEGGLSGSLRSPLTDSPSHLTT
ncbi:DUF6114 domain-containing protein [Streptomyces graminilatus]|uniref:DUF6114 domain-containing protein n=1 Tax=Streptomyces graminilatus TaxID=1464070 RepID=UPI000A4E6059|nr:DUF6114 domain-containing protein [Streptomyces graminilatus]